MLVLSLCLVLASFGQAFAADTSKPATGAADTAGHWAADVLEQWKSQGLISGYQDGSLKPDNQITRAEFTALVNHSFGFNEIASISFKDVKNGAWYYNEISKASAAAYIKGYSDQTFKPNKSITREELAVIVASLLKLNASASNTGFTDLVASHAWSKDSIAAVAEAGLMQGSGGKFRPQQTATRAEAVVVLDRALKLRASGQTVVYDKAGTYGPETGTVTVNGSVYLNAPDITLRNTVINGNLIIGENVGKGDITLKNVTVKGTTVINGGGKNSIHVDDSVLVTVIVNKKDGSIRIVTEGSTSVQQITLQSGALLQESGSGSGFGNVSLSDLIPVGAQVELAGNFNTVDIFATSIRVSLTSGSVQNLQVAPTAGNTTIDLAAGTSVQTLVLNAIAHVTGQGTIGTAYVNVSGSTIAQTPGQVITAPNVTVSVGVPVGGSGGSGGSVTDTVYGFEGTITDVDNQPVADMTINFRRGLGTKEGEIAATVVTDVYGHYFANLAPGIYTGELVKEGFITTYVVGVSLSTGKNIGQDATAIRIPKANEIRIVLTWNENPRDEDSHLFGPTPDGQTFHTWYNEQEYGYQGELYADLDHDDTTSYGPETTTIRKQVDGTYQFYVHNYSGNGPDNAYTLTASGAKVEVYSGASATPVKTYNIPAGTSPELYWHVFDMTISAGSLSFNDTNVLADSLPAVTSPDVLEPIDPDTVHVVNKSEANDTVTVSGLAPGEHVVLSNENISNLHSSTATAESDVVTFTNLNLKSEGGSLTLYREDAFGQHSSRITVDYISEAAYNELVTVANTVYTDFTVPVTQAVYQNVYLNTPGVQVPSDITLNVLGVEPVGTVTSDVYLEYTDGAVKLQHFNGTSNPVQYKVSLELKRGSSIVTKDIILTVPDVRTALRDSVAAAGTINIEAVIARVLEAKAVLNDQQATTEDYINALYLLNEAIWDATH